MVKVTLKKQTIPKEIQNAVSGLLGNYGISLEELLEKHSKPDHEEIERKWLTVAQAIKYTGVSRSTLGRWQTKGLLKQVCKLTPGSRSGKILFLKSEIDLLLSKFTLSSGEK